ncbi:MAG TPA: PstA family ABC transporter permease [Anaerolineaceae bacterium]|nr:PstA family ABC transporter permease [Anaerolineaceae bacterium]
MELQKMTTLSNAKYKDNITNRNRAAKIFNVILLFSVLFGLLMLTVLLIDIAVEGSAWVRQELFNNYHSRKPENAGMKSAIAGSLIVIGLTGLFSFPIGVGAAIYLEEYAPKNKLTDFINLNINNLAGVPSIVYGMLGLVVFGRMFGLFKEGSWLVEFFKIPVESGAIGGWNFNLLGIPWLEMQIPFGRSMVAGAMTMTLLILPVVIIASREAIRAVPPSIREGGYALGTTKWHVIKTLVLPIAFPGILTGMILSLSRAIGETAPLIIMGAFTYVPFLPRSVWDQFTVIPIQIYNWITLPQTEFRVPLAAAGILVLLLILFVMNGIAIYLRKKFEIKW